tara:strand:+ start:387 stop:533 length:147 start_codon:yes stop_codon:yes gene_type:complete
MGRLLEEEGAMGAGAIAGDVVDEGAGTNVEEEEEEEEKSKDDLFALLF